MVDTAILFLFLFYGFPFSLGLKLTINTVYLFMGMSTSQPLASDIRVPDLNRPYATLVQGTFGTWHILASISMVDSVACLRYAECSRAPDYITNGYGSPMQTTSCTWR